MDKYTQLRNDTQIAAAYPVIYQLNNMNMYPDCNINNFHTNEMHLR